MADIVQLSQTFVAAAVFVSAVALSSVGEEAQYYRFMHLSGEAKAPPERRDTSLRAG